MKKNAFSMLILLLAAALVLSACDAIDDYSRRDRGVGIPATGDTATRNDNWNDNLNDNRNANRNDNWNDNRNDNWNDNRNDNWNDNRNDNWNDNANDNAARGRGPGVPATGDDRIARNNLYRVDELTGQTLETRDGVRMGRIDSLLVHPNTGRVHYLVLEPDRDLRVDRDYLLVPWGALHTWSPNPYEGVPPGHLPPPEQREPMNCRDLPPGHLPPPHLRDELCLDYGDLRDDRGLVFGFGRDTMERSPSYTRDELDDVRAGRWENEYREYWHGHIDDVPPLDDTGRGYLRLTGGSVRLLDRDRERLTGSGDLLVNVPAGHVEYALVDSGGLFQRERVLVPFDRLDWSPDDDAYIVDVHRDDLDRLPRYEDRD
jgi:sporulation protein YlmC with PRC-barrel domain